MTPLNISKHRREFARDRNELLAICLSSLVVLSGCAVGPDYSPPTDKPPARFGQAVHPEFSERSVERRWWTLFDDRNLLDLVERAVRNNYDLQAARATLREARALYLEAGLNLAPIVTSHANYSEQKRSKGSLNNRSFVPRELKLYNVGFDAFWELDLFGRVRRDVEASDDEVAAEEASLRDIAVSLIAEVARNYFELRGLQSQLDVARKNVAIQSETLAITQARVAAGRGNELDTARAEAQLEGTKAGMPPLESSIQKTLHRLAVLTGRAPGLLAVDLSEFARLPSLPATIDIGRPNELLRRRPDIRVAERRLAASTARIGVATADLFPRVTFVGNISLEASTFSGLGAAGSESFSAGPKISWPAFDLGRVYARIKAADAHAEADLARYRQTVLNALEETENALIDYNRERVRRQWLASAVGASAKARELAHLRYRAGVSDFLTVLDAEARLLEDQQRLAQSETTVATALVVLYKALGGGWETLAKGDQDTDTAEVR